MTLKTHSLLLMLSATACTGASNNNDTAAQNDEDGGGNAEDWRTGAYADIELSYETTGGEVTTWSFRIEDGEPATTAGVEVLPDDETYGTYFHARYYGCPHDETDSIPTDRPIELHLGKGVDWECYSGWFSFTISEGDCSGSAFEYDCVVGPGAEGSYIDLEMQDSGQFWSGTFAAYGHCLNDHGNGDLVGYGQVVATFEAREEEP